MSTEAVGGYVRHRDRMIQESIYQDLRDTLIACRWMAGTTEQPVIDPNGGAIGVLTVTQDEVLPLLEGQPINLIDYFPESEGSTAVGEPTTNRTPPNTLALDTGTRGDSEPLELGNVSAESVPYTFNLAFFASSDAVAQALLNDLVDRYRGRIVRGDTIALWNYNDPAATDPVNWLEVDSFRYTVNTDSVQAHEVHLYFGELRVVDDVD